MVYYYTHIRSPSGVGSASWPVLRVSAAAGFFTAVPVPWSLILSTGAVTGNKGLEDTSWFS